MSLTDQEKSFARSEAKDIWRVLDYVRSGSPIYSFRSFAYSLFLFRYLNVLNEGATGRYIHESFNELVSYKDELIETSEIHLNAESIELISDYLEEACRVIERFESQLLLKSIKGHKYYKNSCIAELILAELDNLFALNEGKAGGEFYTPNDINLLVKRLGSLLKPTSILDPFAGAGNTAFAFHDALEKFVEIDTQEINRDANFILMINRLVRGIPGVDYLGNSFAYPRYKSKRYDLIASFPPFSMRVPKETRHNINRERENRLLSLTETLPDSRSDWFLVASMLSALTSEGKLIVGMYLGALTRSGAEAKIREDLISEGVIEQVILLPKNIHYSTSISTVIVVMNPGLTNVLENKVRFVDASQIFEPSKGRNRLSEENIKEIVNACISDGRFSISVSHKDICAKGFNLDPSLYVEKSLTIKEVKLENFRGYQQYKISLEKRLNVLVGENGAGKTAVLDAIACGLGPFLTAIPEAKGRQIRKSDIYVGPNGQANYSRVALETGSSLSWDLVAKGSGKHPAAKIGTLALSSYANQLTENVSDYPLIAYYGAGRAITSMGAKVAINPFEKVTRGEGYDSALDAKINYGIIKSWFSKIEVEELSTRDERKDHKYRHPAKEHISKAVTLVVKRVKGIDFVKTNSDLLVSWQNDNNDLVTLTLEQLSEGYRNMVALTIDLVRRAYLLNPDNANPFEAVGIVLIDEIELHLHPRWQQRVLGDLTELFPNIQFVVTTHSPQVLSTVHASVVRILSATDNEAKRLPQGVTTLGSESSRMLEEILGGDVRAQHLDIVKKLERYTELVEQNDWDCEEALMLKSELHEWGGMTEPELQRLNTEIRIREFDRKNESNQ